LLRRHEGAGQRLAGGGGAKELGQLLSACLGGGEDVVVTGWSVNSFRPEVLPHPLARNAIPSLAAQRLVDRLGRGRDAAHDLDRAHARADEREDGGTQAAHDAAAHKAAHAALRACVSAGAA